MGQVPTYRRFMNNNKFVFSFLFCIFVSNFLRYILFHVM